MEILKMIEEHAVAFIAMFGGINIFVGASTVIKTFSQKKLNQSFDAFRNGGAVFENLVGKSDNIISKFEGTFDNLGDFKDIGNEIIKAVHELLNDSALSELRSGITALLDIKEAIDFKDKLIETLAKDLSDIQLKLSEIEGVGGYNDILEVELEAQEVVSD